MPPHQGSRGLPNPQLLPGRGRSNRPSRPSSSNDPWERKERGGPNPLGKWVARVLMGVAPQMTDPVEAALARRDREGKSVEALGNRKVIRGGRPDP